MTTSTCRRLNAIRMPIETPLIKPHTKRRLLSPPKSARRDDRDDAAWS